MSDFWHRENLYFMARWFGPVAAVALVVGFLVGVWV